MAEEKAEVENDELEPWHEWMQRVTQNASEKMNRAKVEDWGVAVRRPIGQLAGHISRRHDGRWSTQMLSWQPVGHGMGVGQPAKRWQDDIQKASDKLLLTELSGQLRRDEWKKMEDLFLQAATETEGCSGKAEGGG